MILNIRLIGWLGVLGAAIANDIGLLLTAILLIIYLKTLTGIQLATGAFIKSRDGIFQYGNRRACMVTASVGLFKPSDVFTNDSYGGGLDGSIYWGVCYADNHCQ